MINLQNTKSGISNIKNEIYGAHPNLHYKLQIKNMKVIKFHTCIRVIKNNKVELVEPQDKEEEALVL